MVSETPGQKIPTKYLIMIYQDLFIHIWKRVSSLVGGITLEVLFSSAIRRLAPGYPFLERIELSVNGVRLDPLEDAEELEPMELKEGFQSLVSELFSLFAAMCGDLLVKELSPKLTEAEEKICRLKGEI